MWNINRLPHLDLLRRQVKRFETGHQASVCLVYWSAQVNDVRWYRLAPDLPYADLEDMLTVEGKGTWITTVN